MSLFKLVLVNLGRNKRRTLLTMLSVVIALFLFCTLRGVLDTLHAAIEVGSESRLVTRNAISLVFPMPLAYRDRIAAVPGVRSVAIQNWFGGRDPNDPGNFFAQFGVDPAFYPMYARDIEIVAAIQPQAPVPVPPGLDPKLAGYLADQTGAVVGKTLFDRMKWKVGQTVTLSGTIYPGDWPFTIAAVYHAKDPQFGEETMLFHWKYLEQKGMGGQGQVGVFVLDLAEPGRAGGIARAVDAMFENSAAQTRTETERAFQAGFISMYGNVPFLIGIIGFAVVFAILLVSANTMMMAARERTAEIGVLKTLGFEDGTVFNVILAEAAIITLGGGLAGALLAKFALEGKALGGFLPPMTIAWQTIALGVAIAVIMGAASGLLPAWQASRLRIVDALRRVE